MNQPVNSIEALFDLLDKNQDRMKALGVARLGVFGSFARNEVTPQSDVDFLVEFRGGEKTFDHFIELAFFLEEITGRKIELLTPESLNKHIGPRILREVSYVPFAA
jgi:uncharacterized protein